MKTLAANDLKCRAASLMLVFCAGVSLAQDVSQADLERCAGLGAANERLACFEALTTGVEPSLGTAAATGADAPPDAARAPAEPAGEPGAPPAAAEATTATESKLPTAPAAPSPASEPGVAPATTVAPPAPSASAGEFGAEHLDRGGSDAEKAKEEVLRATVVEVTEGRYKVLYFRLANGQRWRQIEGRRFRYPKEGDFDVIISRGMMGDYRLRLDEDSPMTRIRRIE
jgi:hypothetical protein